MKRIQMKWLSVALSLAAGMMTVQAASSEDKAPSLKVGDAAPKLQVSKWVQGDEVKEFSKDKAYIVEFWATWCGPCRTSIPHLNEIHTKFKDKGLVVIGQDVWEEDTSKVKPFVEKMGDKMTYRVALDLVPEGEKNGKMAETWMTAAGQNGIPSAFLVDKQGKIAWIGHPMSLKESVIEQVLAGTYDLKKAAEEQAKEKANEGQMMKLGRALSDNMKKKDWAGAESTLTEIEKVLPEDQRKSLDFVRMTILIGKEDFKGAFKMAEKLSDANKDNAMMQNDLAWGLATNPKIKDQDRDLNLLEKIALRASEASKGKDAAILDTLARVYFLAGKKDKALETQEKAISVAEGDAKDDLKKTLESYKNGKIPAAE